MKIEQKLSDFMSQHLYPTRAQYYTNFFSSMSQMTFDEKIRVYCDLTSAQSEKNFLGELDDSNAMLLIMREVIRGKIQRLKLESYHSSKVSIHASEREIRETREIVDGVGDQIQKAWEDCRKVHNKLCKNIEERFSENFDSLLKSSDILLKNRADSVTYGNPGYDFFFFRRKIYLLNWYPLGGD